MEFKRIKQTVVINGVSALVEIVVNVSEDACAGDYELDEETQRSLETGELFYAVINVFATLRSISGSDALGSCCIPSNNHFNSKPFENGVESMLLDHDMVENAVKDLIKNVKDMASELAIFCV